MGDIHDSNITPLSAIPVAGVVLFERCQRDVPKFPGLDGQRQCRRRANESLRGITT
jgi:hypothetical protein